MELTLCTHCHCEFQADLDGIIFCPHCNELVSLPDSDEVVVGNSIGGFEIISLLGTGGMGNVYLAKQVSMQRLVALKILPKTVTWDTQAVEQFMNEVKMSGCLSHPNIVTAIDAGEDNGIYFLAMSFVDGKTIEDIIDSDETISERKALKYALKIAEALDYAWTKNGLFHKDIKPGNLMIDKHDEVYLMDMGIAQRIGDAIEKQDHVEGSPFYMSPEQTMGLTLNWSTDLYSLGTTLYHMITSVPPYDAPQLMHIIEMHSTAPFPEPHERNPNASVSVETTAMLKKMMAKDPAKRYSSWGAYINSLKKLIKLLNKKHKMTAATAILAKRHKQYAMQRMKQQRALRRRKQGPLFFIIKLCLITVATLMATYFLMKHSLEKSARKTLNTALAVSIEEKPDLKRIVEHYFIAVQYSSRFPVGKQYLAEATKGYKYWKILLDKKMEHQKECRDKLDESKLLLAEAKELFSQGKKLFNREKSDHDKYNQAKTRAREAMRHILSLYTVTGVHKQQMDMVKTATKTLLHKIEAAIMIQKNYLIALKQKQARQKQHERREMIRKKENRLKLAAARADLSRAKDRVRVKFITRSKRYDFIGAEHALKPTLLLKYTDECFRVAVDDFQAWASILQSVLQSARYVSVELADSGIKYAGASFTANSKSWKLITITNEVLLLKSGSVSKEIMLSELPPKQFYSLFKNSFNEHNIFSYLFACGNFALAKKLDGGNDAYSKELSAVAKAYIKAILLDEFEKQERGDKNNLAAINDRYGNMPEYTEAYQELRKEFFFE